MQGSRLLRGTGDTQHRRAGAGREMFSRDIKGYFQAIRKQLVVLQIEQAALIARAHEYLLQRASVCTFSPPCPPSSTSPSSFIFVSLHHLSLLARQKISCQIILFKGADRSRFLFNCLYFPVWFLILCQKEQAPQGHFWWFIGKKPPLLFCSRGFCVPAELCWTTQVRKSSWCFFSWKSHLFLHFVPWI